MISSKESKNLRRPLGQNTTLGLPTSRLLSRKFQMIQSSSRNYSNSRCPCYPQSPSSENSPMDSRDRLKKPYFRQAVASSRTKACRPMWKRRSQSSAQTSSTSETSKPPRMLSTRKSEAKSTLCKTARGCYKSTTICPRSSLPSKKIYQASNLARSPRTASPKWTS